MRVLISAFACYPPADSKYSLEERRIAGGEAILGWNLVKQISRFHEVHVLTQAKNHLGVERVIKQEKMRGIKFYYVDLPLSPHIFLKNKFFLHFYYYIWQIKVAFVASRLYKDEQFDVFHHITFANYWMPSFIGAFLPIPFIWGPLGGAQELPKGFLKEFSLNEKIFEISRTISQWIGRNLLISRKQCLKKAKAILVCNYETKEKIPKKFWNKVYLFPVNGISKEDLIPRIKSKPNKNFLILTAGRLIGLKAFHLAIKAFKLFADKFPNSTLEIVGQGHEEKKLRELAYNLGLKDKLIFTPLVIRDDLLRKMQKCDVFLHLSMHEGGGAVVVEAMASGKPVICLDNGGPALHIQKACGIKIAPKSPEYVIKETAKALEKLYLGKELRKRLGKAARKRAEEFYLWDKLGERMQKIYKSALHI